MSHLSPLSVLIVGAGPTGLTLACDLLRRGVSVRLIDQAAAPSINSKAFTLQSRTLELFEALGVLDRIMADGKPSAITDMYMNGRHRIRIDFSDLDAPHPYVVGIPQSDTERNLGLLFAELGGHVEWQRRCTDVQQTDTSVSVTAEDADGKQVLIEADWVVACDGGRSTVRKQLGINFEGIAYERAFMLADVRLDWDGSTEAGTYYITKNGYIIVLPQPGGTYRLAADVREAQLASGELELTQACFQRLLDERGPGGATIMEFGWNSAAPFHRRIVDQYRFGRILLAGDAAHICSPNGAQGLNLGVQDAWNLGWKLAAVVQGMATDKLLDSYDAERRSVAKTVLDGTDRMTNLLTLRRPIQRWLRDTFVPALIKRIHNRLIYRVSGLAITYRDSAAVAHYGGERGVQAGDRVPDVRLLDGRRLFDVLNHLGHTVLLFDAAEYASVLTTLVGAQAQIYCVQNSAEADLLTLPDSTKLRTTFAAFRPTLCVIRPDGHLGFIAQPIQINVFKSWWQQLFMLPHGVKANVALASV